MLLADQILQDLRYVGRAIAHKSITSKHGVELPTEVWLMIFTLALAEKRKPDFQIVRILSVENSLLGKIIHCTRLDTSGLPECGSLENSTKVREFEWLLAYPDSSAARSAFPAFDIDQTELQDEDEEIFSVTLDNSGADQRLLPPCLFIDISVPDIIAYVEGGKCRVCEPDRYICPDPVCGEAGRAFETVLDRCAELPCPLCLGLDFMREDEEFHQRYDGDHPSEEEEEERCEKIECRHRELGYPRPNR